MASVRNKTLNTN